MKSLFYAILLLSPLCLNAQTSAVFNYVTGVVKTDPTSTVAYQNMLCFYENQSGTHNFTTLDITTEVKTIHPITIGNAIKPILILGSDLYFVGCSDINAAKGRMIEELWKYNDEGGHQQVTNLSNGYDNPNVSYVTALNNKIYFISNGFSGTNRVFGQLFEYNPSTGNTKQCTSNLKQAKYLTAYKGKLYFSSYGLGTGVEPWCYDPVSDTAVVLEDIDPDGSNSSPHSFTVVANKLYFVAHTHGCILPGGVVTGWGSELYEYDAKTPVRRITDLDYAIGSGVIGNIVAFKNEVYFGGKDGINHSLYKYTDKSPHLHMLYTSKDFTRVDVFAAHDDMLFFCAETADHGMELWKYDGVNKPKMLADLTPGPKSSYMFYPVSYKNEFYFTALDSKNYSLYRYNEQATNIINNTKYQESIKVYPNPTKSVLYFDIISKGSVAISITDVLGRAVYLNTQYGSDKVAVSTDKLTSGTYYYSISNGDGQLMQSGQFVKN